MSSNKQSLEEYEKDYLERLEKENQPADLQNLIFQASKESKKLEKQDYVGLCIACTKGVERKDMVYKNDHLFHSDCFDQHGNEYQAITNLMNEERRTKVDLVYLKNLQIRGGHSNVTSSTKKKPKLKTKKKSKKRKPARKKKTNTRRKRRVKTKRRAKAKSKRKIKKRRKISRKHFIRKRRTKRRITRRKIVKSSRKRKSRRRR